jgi:predicted phosphodiesterase
MADKEKELFVVVSDIHGNYPALQAVVDEEGTDVEYMVLGDIHGLLAWPAKTQQLVKSVGNFVLSGNHDKAVIEKGEGHVVSDELSAFELEHTLMSLSVEQIKWMLDLPHMEVVQRGQSRIALCHAYPWPSHASGYEPGNAGISKGSVTSVASTVSGDYDYVFHGHTHTQYDLDCSKFGHDVHFVNPGSLGYDHTYSIVETDHGGVTHKSVEVETDVESHIQEQLPEGAPHTEVWL